MPKYVIERTLPGAGGMSTDDWQAIARTSNETIDSLAGRAQWLHSFVTDDKLYCVYLADSPETVAEHAGIGGFPCDSIHQVRRVIDPATAE